MTRPVEIAGAEIEERRPDYRHGAIINVELMYPRMAESDKRANAVEIGICDVRAADNILVEYDFDRDGWSIKQAQIFQWEMEEVCDPKWIEVAFVQAWGSKKMPPCGHEDCFETTCVYQP